MKKKEEYIEVLGSRWSKSKRLSDFYPLIDNLIKEGQLSRAQCVKYLIERIKIVENKLKNSKMLEYLIKQAKFEQIETDGVPGELADILEEETGKKIEDILIESNE
jgi:hypothetical protein